MSRALTYFQMSLSSSQSGCPDFKSPVFLELAHLEPKVDKREQLLEACVQSAENRSRHGEKIYCLQSAGNLLAQSDNIRLRKLGEKCLAKLENLQFVRVDKKNA